MSTSRRKKEARQKQLAAEKKMRELKKQGISTITKKRKPKDFKEYVAKNETYRPDEKYIPSLSSSEFNTARADSKHYTGDFIKGIGTMHKSNAIPVVDPEFMKELARMRRN